MWQGHKGEKGLKGTAGVKGEKGPPGGRGEERHYGPPGMPVSCPTRPSPVANYLSISQGVPGPAGRNGLVGEVGEKVMDTIPLTTACGVMFCLCDRVLKVPLETLANEVTLEKR